MQWRSGVPKVPAGISVTSCVAVNCSHPTRARISVEAAPPCCDEFWEMSVTTTPTTKAVWLRKPLHFELRGLKILLSMSALCSCTGTQKRLILCQSDEDVFLFFPLTFTIIFCTRGTHLFSGPAFSAQPTVMLRQLNKTSSPGIATGREIGDKIASQHEDFRAYIGHNKWCNWKLNDAISINLLSWWTINALTHSHDQMNTAKTASASISLLQLATLFQAHYIWFCLLTIFCDSISTRQENSFKLGPQWLLCSMLRWLKHPPSSA